jgi:cation-transporting ATPase E
VAGELFDECGLDQQQVRQRLADGRDNRTVQPTSRSAWSIVRANVLTRFNALLSALCVLVLVVGPVQDALFGLVVIANSAVGIVAEMRAKRTLDRLQVLTATAARVLREGRLVDVPVDQVVLDDVVEARTGDQVLADGVVLTVDGAETDESLLTGEADPVRKGRGDEVLSGSSVVAGVLRYRANRVGPAAYANALASEARQFSCYDNAAVESFFATLKRELAWIHQRTTWSTRTDLRTALFDYIEGFYNPERIHNASDIAAP